MVTKKSKMEQQELERLIFNQKGAIRVTAKPQGIFVHLALKTEYCRGEITLFQGEDEEWLEGGLRQNP